MNEKAVNVADKPEKKRKKIGKYDVIILLIGIGLMVAGIAGNRTQRKSHWGKG